MLACAVALEPRSRGTPSKGKQPMIERLFWMAILSLEILSVPAWQSSLIPHEIETCQTDRHTHKQSCALYGLPVAILIQTGETLEDHTQATNASFAIAFSIATARLWLATRTSEGF
jgi:hypothetical protein